MNFYDKYKKKGKENSKLKPLLTIKDIIRFSQLSDSTIRRAINKGFLKPFKIEGKKLFKYEAVASWLNG